MPWMPLAVFPRRCPGRRLQWWGAGSTPVHGGGAAMHPGTPCMLQCDNAPSTPPPHRGAVTDPEDSPPHVQRCTQMPPGVPPRCLGHPSAPSNPQCPPPRPRTPAELGNEGAGSLAQEGREGEDAVKDAAVGLLRVGAAEGGPAGQGQVGPRRGGGGGDLGGHLLTCPPAAQRRGFPASRSRRRSRGPRGAASRVPGTRGSRRRRTSSPPAPAPWQSQSQPAGTTTVSWRSPPQHLRPRRPTPGTTKVPA